MNISSVATNSVSCAAQAPTTRPAKAPDPFAAVSGVLGMSADDVRSAVSSGSSLADLATSKGVSLEDLTAALEAGAPAELQGTQELGEIVSTMVQQTGDLGPSGPRGAGGPGGPPPPPPSGVMTGNLTDAQGEVLETLGELLGTSSEDLLAQLQEGADLGELLRDAGVSVAAVAEALQSGFLVDVSA